MCQLQQNDCITLSEAAALSPGRPHVASVWRWARRGVKTRSGGRVRLKHIRAGGKLYTSEAWLRQFFEAVAAADAAHFDADPPTPPKPPTDRQRQKSIEQAERTLQEAGVL